MRPADPPFARSSAPTAFTEAFVAILKAGGGKSVKVPEEIFDIR
jgi:hypothetical protein